MPMTMPKIFDCEMTDCVYNTDNECHTIAITVGDQSPICDTCMKGSKKGGIMDMTAGVGACKVESCMFNQSLECSVEGIHIRQHSGHAECDTFEPM